MITVGKVFYSDKNEFVKFGISELNEKGFIGFYFIGSKLSEVRALSDEKIKKLHDIFYSFNSYKEIEDYAKNRIGVHSIYIDDRIWEKVKPILNAK